jgi:hypothetical protein
MIIEYVSACERASTAKMVLSNLKNILIENKSQNNHYQKFSKVSYAHFTKPVLGTALTTNCTKVWQNRNNSLKCRYCSKIHWIDESSQYKTIDERKGCLKESCYRCLKEGHSSKQCQSRKNVCIVMKKMYTIEVCAL